MNLETAAKACVLNYQGNAHTNTGGGEVPSWCELSDYLHLDNKIIKCITGTSGNLKVLFRYGKLSLQKAFPSVTVGSGLCSTLQTYTLLEL
jgi:hypothetical protein